MKRTLMLAATMMIASLGFAASVNMEGNPVTRLKNKKVSALQGKKKKMLQRPQPLLPLRQLPPRMVLTLPTTTTKMADSWATFWDQW